jgi:GGDEF domain-containing protein
MTQELKKEITRLKREMSRLHGLIETDSLTNLYNRYGFTKRTEGFLKEIEWKLKHRQEPPENFY